MKVRSQYDTIAENPLRYLYKHVLPIETSCQKCGAILEVDSVRDFRYNMGTPPGSNNPEGPYLTIWCAICDTDIRFEAFGIFKPIEQQLFIRSIKNFYYAEMPNELQYKHPFIFNAIVAAIPLIILSSFIIAAIVEG